MKILGIAYLSDASACILDNGQLIAAVSEERINRKKLWHGVPELSVSEVLNISGLKLDEIDLIATHGKASHLPEEGAFERAIERIERSQLTNDAKEDQIAGIRKRFQHEKTVYAERTPAYLKEIESFGKPVLAFGHHEAHAASAYYASAWKDCYIMTADGWGEDGSSTLYRGQDGLLKRLRRSSTIDSMGYFYGSITKALGFTPHRHEGKILGLAAYSSSPQSLDMISNMIRFDETEQRVIGGYDHGFYLPSFNNPKLESFAKEFSRQDVAAAAQMTLEKVVDAFISSIPDDQFKIALAGGIFANVKLNQRIREHQKVEDVFVFPNMGDGGLSVGAAYLAHLQKTDQAPMRFQTALLGSKITNEQVKDKLENNYPQLQYEYAENIEDRIAQLLAEKNVVAVANGKMEYGPRALGNRSILFHCADASVNEWLNTKLHRSEFMPFAPATLAEDAKSCYVGIDEHSQPKDYMTMTYDCTESMKQESPAAVHIDGTARPQIIDEVNYPFFYKILKSYKARTGMRSLINTSFNMHEEPIVRTADDALRAFIDGGLPYLAIGNYLVTAAK